MSIIGILGGNGTMASLNFTIELVGNTLSYSDSERPNFILRNLPPKKEDTFVYDGNIEIYSPLNDLISAAKSLEDVGASVLVMPCNSLHYFYDDIKRLINIKFLSIIEVTVEKIKNSYPDAKNVAVLATGVTMEKGIYKKVLNKHGLNQIQLPLNIQEKVNICVFDGDNEDDIIRNKNIMQDVINYVQNETKADVFIAGCTEVPLFIKHIESNLPIINSSLELAKAAIKYSNYKLTSDPVNDEEVSYNSHYTLKVSNSIQLLK